MRYTFYEIALLFYTYSFLAWLAETSSATIKAKGFRNRGFVSGPFCFIYGFTSVVMTVFLQELRHDVFFLFLGSMVTATAMEWFTGKLLERMGQKKWWDYSDKKWNINGYICLQYSLAWGFLGFVAVRYANDFVLCLYRALPDVFGKIAIWGISLCGLVDFSGSFLAVYHAEEKLPRLFRWNYRIQQWMSRFSVKLLSHVGNRIGKAYPSIAREETAEDGKDREKCSFAELFWLFLIGAFLGDVVETVFCRVTAGIWMSRSSLVWGPFSIVWGLAIALVTALLYRERDKQEHYIFCVGTFLGGAYEYICSVFTELVFGKVFWDYSGIPFNLGGRINLLYCFFWGIAAVVWIKALYPGISRLVRVILKRTRWAPTAVLTAFMALDICVSAMALIRYDTRAGGSKAVYQWEQAMDKYFDDARMERIYPNAKPQ